MNQPGPDRIQNDLKILTERLSRINDSLARKVTKSDLTKKSDKSDGRRAVLGKGIGACISVNQSVACPGGS